MKLQNRLKQQRQNRGFTQAELATAVHVTRQTIIAVEKGRFNPSVKLALEIAQALNTPITELFWLDQQENQS